ncbi:beta-galactosidase [Cohnella silvisoli]|uniref:Beta-galactosidase n=1 Tax=Cohnella silvisoli TaxID=2873699 RepID=A0ABV1L212_9BACL|nr:beta-galactosidase [Cohnella silvisoli]MCD9025699.1 beta-galactosidase [Cohnella silvisoli]
MSKGNKHEVVYDDTSYIIDGKRIWLACGEMHYFRTPAALWKDRLLKAKRAGLNCVSTYMPWNMHETSEGEFDFSGDLDVEAFIRLAGELGLYIILRPGPYICSEWDFGGYPAWLSSKEGILYRTNEPTYSIYYKRYFARALPPLAALDATRGGNIILIQNENEHHMPEIPGRLSYFHDIDQAFREAGFRIPIINCNRFVDSEPTGTIECVNTWDDPIGDLLYMRRHQPHAPLLVTEFWSGGLDSWGRGHVTKPVRDVVRKSIEILGCGSQNTYYMWHGGTNFAFWGGRLQYEPFFHIITSYDMDSPLAEGGELTPKYYGTKLVTTLASSMGAFFADKRIHPEEVTVQEGITVLPIKGGGGGWITATRGERDDAKEIGVSMPDGTALLVSLEPYGAVIVPYGLQLTDSAYLNYTNLMPFGWFPNMLVLHGPPEWDTVVCINGTEFRDVVPSGDVPEIHRIDDLTVIILSTELAEHTWWLDGSLIVGAAYVGADYNDIRLGAGIISYSEIRADGSLLRHVIGERPDKSELLLTLDEWKCIERCSEPFGNAAEWMPIEGPTGLTELNILYGYGWYKIEFETESPRKLNVRLPHSEDRIILYANGQAVGVWGYGEGATLEGIPLQLQKGANTIVALADNLGRMTHSWKIGEPKGIVNHLFESHEITMEGPEWREGVFDRSWIPEMPGHLNQNHRIPELELMRLSVAEYTLDLATPQPVQLMFTVEHPVMVKCNGTFIGFYENPGRGFGDVLIPASLLDNHNRIEILLWGEANGDALDSLKVYVLADALTTQAKWSFSPWLEPQSTLAVDHTGDGFPAWYRADFSEWPRTGPAYLRLNHGWKGQIFFNGHNVGRYWNVPPQQDYYLPECWFQPNNTLLLFDESGQIPTGAVIVSTSEWRRKEQYEKPLDVVPTEQRA